MPRIKYKEAIEVEAKRGKPSMGSKPSKTVLQRLYVREGRSIREIADLQGCTKDMVARALKEYGIEARKNVKRSELRKQRQGTLRTLAERKGIRGAARDLGVNPSTLSRFLRSKTEK
jgi:DNA-binding MarR family transcriptional regulator